MSDSRELRPEDLFEPAVATLDGKRTRAASVTFRDTSAEADDPASLMDPAQKALAEALRITFRLLQIAMIVLLALFFLSGSQRVTEGERGIRLLFGRPIETDLGPGFQWSLPYPFGELVKISSAPPSLSLDEAFYPYLSAEQKRQSTQQLVEGGWGDSLNPERDRAVITAEGYLAHVKAVVKYRREDPKRVHERIHPDSEAKIVEAAVRRGIVHAAATLSSDEFLTGNPDPSRAPGEFRSAEQLAREAADKLLRDYGIAIENLSLVDALPPLGIAKEYGMPQQVQASARDAINRAIQDRQTKLATVAGPAAPIILEQIDLYEEQLRLGQEAEAEATHDRIMALLQGKPVEIDGEVVNPRIEGEVQTMLSEASLARDTTIARAQGDARLFQDIRTSYYANPAVVLNDQWTSAFTEFLKRPTVQVQLLAPGERWVLHINRDPEFTRKQEYERRRKEAEELEKARQRERERERLRRTADPDKAVYTAD
jgi:regulator of protease activity HflC (stomatin/prohibitin superfamily)